MKKETGIDIFELIEKWFAFASDKKLSGNHTALFFFCVELNNKLAWKPVFGLPTYDSCEYIGISPNTFRKCLSDLVKLNMIEMVKKSPNQFTANQISMKLAYQNLLSLSEGSYQSIIKAQLSQLLKRCTIDKHIDTKTIKQLDILKEENLNLKNKIKELKRKKVGNRITVEDAKLFYKKEIEEMNGEASTNTGKNYLFLIDFLLGIKDTPKTTKEVRTNVLTMPAQLSFSEFEKLMKLKPEKQSVISSIETLNNGIDANGGKYSRHTGIFSTIKTWYERDNK